jgi:hypothetical protein
MPGCAASHMKPIVAAVTLTLALTACSAPPPTPSRPTSARTVSVIDGLYRGTSTRFQANSRNCPRPGLVSIQLWDRKFEYRWDRNTYIEVVVLPDGSLHGEVYGVSLTGRLDGDKITGDVTNGDCGLHFTLRKRDF